MTATDRDRDVLARTLWGEARGKPEVRTMQVEVPVQVPCKAPIIAATAFAAAGLKKADSLEVKVRALLAERRQHIGYEKELVATVGACQ